jgi:hypothetical protein
MAEFISQKNVPFFKEAVNGKNVILWPDTSIHDGYPYTLIDSRKQ